MQTTTVSTLEYQDRSPWDRHAVHWKHIEAPLLPIAQDLQFAQAALNRVASERDCVAALLLGVTAGLANLDWPDNSSLTAVDSSFEMIRRHWRPPVGVRATSVHCSWDQLSLPPESIDIVLGDGSLSILPGSQGLRAVIGRLTTV